MVIASVLGLFAALCWIGLVGYIATVLTRRSRHENAKFSISLIVGLIVLATLFSSTSSGLVVIDAGEVGVVFNSFTGTRDTPLDPGIHFITPYVETVYRYSTLEQVYTMSKIASEGQVQGDDSLWSPTLEGLQVGIDSSTRYKINPAKAAFLHNNLRDYNNIVVRPAIRSIVRLHVSRHTVTDVYGPKRAEIQAAIESDIRTRFEPEGLLLLSFDIRNVNFTDDYSKSIEQKQIAQQQAEQMQFVLDKESKEAERKRVEAGGIKDSAVIKAEGDAQALKLISEALSTNPNLIQYRYIEKLAPNIQVMLVPSNSPFLLDAKSLGINVPSASTAALAAPAAAVTPAPTPTPAPTTAAGQ
jgi:regulator of protease activity HflC (stomatin/prohibitin superfamily)